MGSSSGWRLSNQAAARREPLTAAERVRVAGEPVLSLLALVAGLTVSAGRGALGGFWGALLTYGRWGSSSSKLRLAAAP